MVKKSQTDFMKSIINVLDEIPRNALEISKLSKTSWESTNNLLIALAESKLIKCIIIKKTNKYSKNEIENKIIMQINIETTGFKHLIKPLNDIEKLALIQYLNMIKKELEEDFEIERIDF